MNTTGISIYVRLPAKISQFEEYKNKYDSLDFLRYISRIDVDTLQLSVSSMES